MSFLILVQMSLLILVQMSLLISAIPLLTYIIALQYVTWLSRMFRAGYQIRLII